MSPCWLLQLDDDVLLRILGCLAPLPDRFHASRTCHRLHNLGLDRRFALCVVPSVSSSFCSTTRASPLTFGSLEDALKASRPGDTLWLAPCVHTIRGVVVQHQVRLQGGGNSPTETLLVSCKGADMGLDFRATCLVVNLSMRSTVSPCIVHRAGHLRVEQCKLTCMSQGLDHLCSPILTLAASPPQSASASNPAAPDSARHGKADRSKASDVSAVSVVAAAAGKLLVSDTQLTGGGKGVQCRGTGQLQSVRAIYGPRQPFFFFEVDSRVPGHPFQPLGLPNTLVTSSSSRPSATASIAQALSGIDHGKMLKLSAHWREGRKLARPKQALS